ncbi:MAG: hypothetical protein U9N82_08570 [Thermodesulfobacteriota bacterium]|nr:hypothetical protein [Thermodesulfobacteriota bacterium]
MNKEQGEELVWQSFKNVIRKGKVSRRDAKGAENYLDRIYPSTIFRSYGTGRINKIFWFAFSIRRLPRLNKSKGRFNRAGADFRRLKKMKDKIPNRPPDSAEPARHSPEANPMADGRERPARLALRSIAGRWRAGFAKGKDKRHRTDDG